MGYGVSALDAYATILSNTHASHVYAGKGGELNYGPYYTKFPYIFPNITNVAPTASQRPRGPHATDGPTARRLYDETVKLLNKKLPPGHQVDGLTPRDTLAEE